jgi:hypothetical protein
VHFRKNRKAEEDKVDVLPLTVEKDIDEYGEE